jgi:hypothetical protein
MAQELLAAEHHPGTAQLLHWPPVSALIPLADIFSSSLGTIADRAHEVAQGSQQFALDSF